MIFLKTVVMTIVFLSVKNRWLGPAVEKKGVTCQMRLVVPDYAGMLMSETIGAAVPPMTVAAGRGFGRGWKGGIKIIGSYDA